MTNHCTNDTMLSGIYFSPEFLKMRDRRISNWSIPEEQKKALEQSIERGSVTVENTGTMNCQNDVEGKNQT